MPFKHFKNLKIWALFALLLMLTTSLSTAAFNTTTHANVTAISDEVAHLFPSATRVGPIDKNIAVTPVYQLNELLGYVFESDDFVNFIGFSGQTINLLIGIDTQGVFTGLKILAHNEPIFLHGLGEQSMFKFIKQYQGHSIKERFIVNARSKTANDITYIDGVTRATISVLVINDTITASALKVARERLSGFVAPSQVSINPDYYQTLSFTELLDKNFITHWQLSREQALALTETSPTNLANEIKQISEEGDDFIDLYFAFVNIPVIGKNLLGEEEYQRLLDSLKPGEHALMMFGSGQYHFVSEDFTPQTVPNRLSAQQASLPVDLRDIDFYSFYDPSFSQTVPDFNEIKVFRIKSQSGFELNKEFSLSLMVSYNKSFLAQQQYSFLIDNTLPESLFIENIPEINPEENRPLWLKIWISRSTDILILSIYLVFLVWLFIKQETLAQNANATHKICFTDLLHCCSSRSFFKFSKVRWG